MRLAASGKPTGVLFSTTSSNKKEESNLPFDLAIVLQEFHDVFEEHHGLPPQQTHDHRTLGSGHNTYKHKAL